MRWFVLLLLAALVASAAPSRADGEWLAERFEDNLTVTIDPAEPTDRTPVNVEVASKTVEGKTVVLKRVDLIEGQVLFPGQTTPTIFSGSFYETGTGGTRWKFPTIPAYPNGTFVSFRVQAYDVANEPKTSNPYNYTVRGTLTSLPWRYETFDENLNLSWSPAVPEPQDGVVATLVSRDPAVLVQGANLQIIYQYFDEPEQRGGFSFTRVNATTLRASLPGYRAGTTVHFWVEAWDVRNTVMISEVHNYTLSVSRYTNNPLDPYPQPELVAGGLLAAGLAVPIVVWRYVLRREEA